MLKLILFGNYKTNKMNKCEIIFIAFLLIALIAILISVYSNNPEHMSGTRIQLSSKDPEDLYVTLYDIPENMPRDLYLSVLRNHPHGYDGDWRYDAFSTLEYNRWYWYDRSTPPTPFVWNNSGRIPKWGIPLYARIHDYYKYY